MNINIDGLQAFVWIAEFGTFHQAAEKLALTQPALSRRLQKLEEHLEVRLFDRTTRKVTLTAMGKNFLPHARRLVSELELSLSGLKEMARHGTGQVIVACIPTVAVSLIPEVILHYRKMFPNNHVRILDDHSTETYQAVLRGEAEFGITTVDANMPDMESEPLFEDPFVLACRHDHPLSKKNQVKWGDLEKHNLITVGRLSGNRSHLDIIPSMITMRPLWAYEVQRSFWTGLKMVECGLGIIAVPQLALPTGKHSNLIGRPLVKPSLSRTIGIIRRKGTSVSPAALEFSTLLKNRWRTKRSNPGTPDSATVGNSRRHPVLSSGWI